jgi:pimeloyl-ACP methyl ester carboxylesterase
MSFPSFHLMQKLAFPGVTPAQRLKTLFSVFYHSQYLQQHPQVFGEASMLYARIGAQSEYATKAQLLAAQDARPYYKWLAKIRVPLLVMHGEEELVWTVKNAYTLAKGVGERAELAIFAQAGHMLFQEKAAEFNARLEQFLEQG